MKTWMTFTAVLAFVAACGQQERKEAPPVPVVEKTSTSASTPEQTQAPVTPTAPAPTTPTTPTPAPTTPAPTTPTVDCSDMQAILQAALSGGDLQQIAQECLNGMGGSLPGGVPGLPTGGGNTP